MRPIALAIAALAVLCALVFARPHPTPGPAMRDFEAYYAAGATWKAAHDPYSLAIWNSERALPGVRPDRYEVLPFVGPPGTLPVWAAFASLPFIVASYLWRIVLYTTLATLLWLAAPVAGLRRTPLTLMGLLIAALGFGPLTSALALGQFALPAALAAFAVVVTDRFGMKNLGTLVACLQPNLAFSLIPQLRERKNAVPVISGVAVFIAICLLAGGFQAVAHYIGVARSHNLAEQFEAIQINPGAIICGFGATASLSNSISPAIAVLAILTWVWNIGRVRVPVAAFSLTCFLIPFVTTFFHEHDFALLFAPALVMVMRAPRTHLPVTLAGAMLCATDWLGLAQRPDGLIQTFLLVASFGTAVLALRNDFDTRAIVAAALVLCGVIAAGIYARVAPLPVWPDAMHPLAIATNTGNIAVIWHAEQAATGLFAHNTFWALLRCATLAGCALLAYATVSSKSLADSKTLAPAPA